MPLALPLRWGGALDINAFMLGVWNSPKPMPQITMRQTMLAMLGLAGRVESSSMPRPSSTRPRPPSTPAEKRSDNRPPIGAMIATTSGHGVRKKPVST